MSRTTRPTDDEGIIDAIEASGDAPATSVGNGSKNVTTAGTRVQLSVTSVPIKKVTIRAKADNTGFIYVGGSTVSSSSNIYLQPMDSIPLDVANLNAVWLDSSANGDGVFFTYEA